jgi:exodeoxyribonuclease VII small subunit
MAKQESYKALQERLDQAVSLLEGGDIGVDVAVSAYEDALKIIKQLEAHLQSAENHVQELAKTYGEAA